MNGEDTGFQAHRDNSVRFHPCELQSVAKNLRPGRAPESSHKPAGVGQREERASVMLPSFGCGG